MEGYLGVSGRRSPRSGAVCLRRTSKLKTLRRVGKVGYCRAVLFVLYPSIHIVHTVLPAYYPHRQCESPEAARSSSQADANAAYKLLLLLLPPLLQDGRTNAAAPLSHTRYALLAPPHNFAAPGTEGLGCMYVRVCVA